MGNKEDRESEIRRIQNQIDHLRDLIDAADPDSDDYECNVSEWETKISNLESRLTFFD